MKKYFILFFILITCNKLLAQDENNLNTDKVINNKGDVILELSPNLLSIEENQLDFAGGFNIQSYIGRKFNVNGYLFVGRRYGYFNIGLLTVPVYTLLFNKRSPELNSLDDIALTIILIVTVFENPSFHIPVNSNSDFSLNLSLLRLIWDTRNTGSTDSGTPLFPAFATGLRYNHYFGKFVVSPYGELAVQYKGFVPHVNAGIHLGFYFPHK